MTGQTEPRLVEPAPFVPAQPGPAADSDGHAETATAAGSLLAGRYRLGSRVGSDAAAGAEFWRAEDTVLRRDVAATVLRRFGAGTDPDDDGGAGRAQDIIARALRSGSFEHPGCARLLDVLAPGAPGLPDGVLGAAVAEWVPGRSLAEAVADGMLKPLAAARALQPLAAAAEAAHRHGHVLGCDHPQRIRLNHDGRLQLGFALPRPELTPADDVRGLGAALYTLLTGLWPLSASDAARAGLRAADRGPDGAPLPPSSVRPGVPVELETLVVGTLGTGSDTGRVRTAAAVRSVVDEVVAEADRVVLFPPEHDGVPPEPGDVWQPRGALGKQPDPRRRRKLAIGMAGLALCVLAVAGYMSVQLGELFGDPTPRIVVGSSAGGGQAAPQQSGDGSGASVTDAAVKAVGADVYDDAGDRDNAGRVSRVIDGNPDTGWKTFNYKQQFPALKPGVGLMASFAESVKFASVVIDSPSPNTIVQIRTAPSGTPSLDETKVIGEATLQGGKTEIKLANAEPTQYILVWVIQLGDGNKSALAEVQFIRAR